MQTVGSNKFNLCDEPRYRFKTIVFIIQIVKHLSRIDWTVKQAIFVQRKIELCCQIRLNILTVESMKVSTYLYCNVIEPKWQFVVSFCYSLH